MEWTISMWAGLAQLGIAVAIAGIGIRIVLELRKAELTDQPAK
ncbi:MAG TPA: hypothetical protein VN038_14000 [Dyadobacter sp.]|jgi:hypothetical protein|nr:hypothetical protein [Dyadobacter sp.]